MKGYSVICFLAQTAYMEKFLFKSYWQKYSCPIKLQDFSKKESQERVKKESSNYINIAHVVRHPWKLQVDYVTLLECGQ